MSCRSSCGWNIDVSAVEPGPTDTGWTWNGVQWNNPNGCHVFQQMILVQTEASVPRSYGNPHYNGGQMFNAALTPVALPTASVIGATSVAATFGRRTTER